MNIEVIMDAVIERSIRETRRHGGSVVDYSDGDADVEMGEPAKPVVVKTEEEKRGRKKANVRQQETRLPNKFSAPQYFTTNVKTPPKKTGRIPKIPKITEKVTLPSPSSSLMSGPSDTGDIPASMIPGKYNLSLFC